MGIQNSINSAFGSIAGAGAVVKHLTNQKEANDLAAKAKQESLEFNMAENAIDKVYREAEVKDLGIQADVERKDFKSSERAFNKANREFKKGNIKEDELNQKMDEYIAADEAYKSTVTKLNAKYEQLNKIHLRRAILEKQYGNDELSSKIYTEVENTIRGGK